MSGWCYTVYQSLIESISFRHEQLANLILQRIQLASGRGGFGQNVGRILCLEGRKKFAISPSISILQAGNDPLLQNSYLPSDNFPQISYTKIVNS